MGSKNSGLHHVTAIAEILRNFGADVTIRFFNASHGLTNSEVKTALHWLGKVH
jgi:predicted esterase